MPVTRTENSGDGVTTTLISMALTEPDGNGGSMPITGSVQQPGGALTPITGSPLTWPAAPGSGSLYCNINVDTGNGGVATVQTSTVADPAVLNATSVIVFREVMTASTQSTDLDSSESSPDSV